MASPSLRNRRLLLASSLARKIEDELYKCVNELQAWNLKHV
jgi:hypothetical protein